MGIKIILYSMRTSFYPGYFDEVGLCAPAIGMLLMLR